MRIVLYQPDIPQNVGAIFRIAACFGAPVDIIEPCGFVFDERRIKRVAMDYIQQTDYTKHSSWNEFLDFKSAAFQTSRLVLLTTKSSQDITDFIFQKDDFLLFGRESSGVPDEVYAAASARIKIPMQENARSLNVAVSVGITVFEGMRQTLHSEIC